MPCSLHKAQHFAWMYCLHLQPRRLYSSYKMLFGKCLVMSPLKHLEGEGRIWLRWLLGRQAVSMGNSWNWFRIVSCCRLWLTASTVLVTFVIPTYTSPYCKINLLSSGNFPSWNFPASFYNTFGRKFANYYKII
jgi:hypothetical protein